MAQNSSNSPHVDFEEVIPGTRRLFDPQGNPLPGDVDLLKAGDIVLIPQPTDSPNDPLQWSLPRKLWHSALVCYVTAMTASTSNIAGTAAYGQNEELGIDYSYFNTGAGVLFIGIGYWVLLGSPAVHLYGRRILYLIGMIVGVIGNVWFARTQTATDTIWSQLFVGASESVAEATAQLSLMDLWFQHQIGSVLGIYVLATSVGTYLGPLISSHNAENSGWRWVGYLSAIFSGVTLIVFYFTLEETEFWRERYLINRGGQRYLMDGREVENVANRSAGPGEQQRLRGSIDNTNDKPSSSPDLSAEKEKQNAADNHHPSTTPSNMERLNNRESASYARPKTYWQRIALITPAPNIRGWGFKQYGIRLFHTLRVFTFPAVWYAGIQWGLQSSCLTFYLTVQEDIWYGPPWYYSDAQVGNMNIPALIGSVIGCFFAGWGSDWLLLWITKHKMGGIMEAEQRLWPMYMAAIIFPTGMLLFGIGSANGWDWPIPYVGLGFIGFGYGCAGDLSMAYLVDAYPEMVLEGMVGVAVINNTMGMIFSFAASPWLDASGVQNTFIALAVLAFIFLMLTLPIMIWGKTFRRWTRGRYMRFLELRDGFDK